MLLGTSVASVLYALAVGLVALNALILNDLIIFSHCLPSPPAPQKGH